MVELILEAIKKAQEKHGEFPECKKDGYIIIAEEFGEIAQSISDKESIERTKSEVMDTAVACLRFLEKHC